MNKKPKYPKLIQDHEGSYLFILPDKSLSQDFFWAENFVGNHALVIAKRFGKHQYLDLKGYLSDEYSYASRYSCGYGLVQKDDGGKYQYRDSYGDLSEEFYYAKEYEDGYGIVQRDKNSPKEYRDILGNLSRNRTMIGDMAYQYYKGKLTMGDLPDECFLNKKFFKLMYLVEAVNSKNEAEYYGDEDAQELFADSIQYMYNRRYAALVSKGELDYSQD